MDGCSLCLERYETKVSELLRQPAHTGEPFVFTDQSGIVLDVVVLIRFDQQLAGHTHQGVTILHADDWNGIRFDVVVFNFAGLVCFVYITSGWDDSCHTSVEDVQPHQLYGNPYREAF